MKKLLSSAALIGLLLGAAPAFAQTPDVPTDVVAMEASSDVGDAGYAEEALFLGIEIVNLLLVFIAIVILAIVIGRYGMSELSGIFTYFMIATGLLGATRLFILIADNGILPLSDEWMAMSWHSIFYLAMITFILGAKSLVNLATKGESNVTKAKLVTWAIISIGLTVAMFIFAPSLDTWYVNLTTGTMWETFGWMHFISFTLAGITAFYVFQRTKVGHITKLLSTPLLIAIALTALQHLWELATESWKLFAVDPAVIEQVELVFVVPAFALIAYAFSRMLRLQTNA